MAFKIPSIPPTTNKTVRFPNDLIERVEALICNKDCTFSAFVVAAVRAAVEEVESSENTLSEKEQEKEMGFRIRDLREDADLTQKQIAELLMCDQSLDSKY